MSPPLFNNRTEDVSRGVQQGTGGLPRYDSSRINREISDISDDSIRQLLKLASLDPEMLGLPEDFEVSECYDWDLPPPYYQAAWDLKTEVESWRFQQNPNWTQEGQIPTIYNPTGQDLYPLNKLESGLDNIPEESEQEANVNTNLRYEFSSMMDYDLQDNEPNFSEALQPDGQPESFLNPVPEPRTMEGSLELHNSKMNLVVGNNVVMLDPQYCPKPDVRVLPSQVVKQSDPNTAVLTGTCVSTSQQQVTSSTGFKPEPMNPTITNWPANQNQGLGQDPTGPFNPGNGQQMGSYQPLQHQLQSTGDFMKVEGGFMTGSYDPVPSNQGPQGDQILRSTTAQTTDFLNLDQTAEAEICTFVKSYAPEMQNQAWEEIRNETGFEEQIKQAKLQIRELNQQMEIIKHKIQTGEIDMQNGKQMIRTDCEKRERIATQARAEQDRIQGLIKRRTLEKICNWMREHLIGNPELLRESSGSRSWRRSQSEGHRRRQI